MTRKKKLALNTITSILNQVIVLVAGIILPQAYIKAYGSEVNGLVASIVQFVTIISFLELGVGAVVQASLYKPLAQKNIAEISKIIISSNRFFKKIGGILVLYSVALFLFYPVLVGSSYSFIYTGSLIAIIAFSSFAEYYFGVSYRILLTADQLGFTIFITNIITRILNTIVVLLMIRYNQSIQMVRLLSSLIFLIKPVFYQIIVRRRYALNLSIPLDGEPIKQKWNGIARHISGVILDSTDIVVLTLFSSFNAVSVYSIYYLIVNSIRKFLRSFSSGFLSLFGSLLSNNEMSKLKLVFEKYEWMMHFIVIVIYTITGVMIIPFIQVYTLGIKDISYIYPLFAILITMSQALYCLRLPYDQMILAAGHFKQTQTSSFIEAGLNIVVSVVLVNAFGLVGVAIGTITAVSYRTVYLVWYLSKNITNRKIKHFLYHCFVDILVVVVTIFATRALRMHEVTYLGWVIMAFKVSFICVGIALGINFMFFPNLMINLRHGIRK